MDAPRILVVDDEATLCLIIDEVLTDAGCDVTTAGSAEEALEILETETFDVTLFDIILPGINGLTLLERVKESSPQTEVIMMTSASSVDSVLRALRTGAYDYLQKPFENLDEIWIHVNRALEKHRLERENRELMAQMSERNAALSEAVKRMGSFIDAGNAMSRFESLQDLLDFFIGIVASELGVERASILLLDEASEELLVGAHRGMEGLDPESIRIKLGEGVAGNVARTGEAYLVRDAQEELQEESRPELAASFISTPIRLSVPIKSSSTILGVINVTNRANGTPLEDNDLKYLSGMAGQLAVAIERARHFQSLQTAYRTLEATQEQLVLSERRKVLGEMAAGVAHDFNNDLSIILGKTQLSMGLLEDPNRIPEIQDHLELVQSVALRGAQSIRRIQDYTRIRRDSPDERVDVNEVIRDAVQMTRPKWHDECEAHGATVRIVTELGDIPATLGNTHELNQMVSNLLFNAVDAMPEGGCFTIRTGCDGTHLALEFEDTGIGMNAATTKRVFEPFFTTKESGNGLGTSVVFGIVQRHGGQVTVESQENKGTKFTVLLPLRQTNPAKAPDAMPLPETDHRTSRILLAEDDDLVRETLVDLLAIDGHQVEGFATGDDALVQLGQDPSGFDLVVTDLNMPGLSGLDVTRATKEVDPSLPVILLSGWSALQHDAKTNEAGVDFVLTKPVSMEQLTQTVQRALAKRRDGSSSEGDRP